jgi:hypothetical protein
MPSTMAIFDPDSDAFAVTGVFGFSEMSAALVPIIHALINQRDDMPRNGKVGAYTVPIPSEVMTYSALATEREWTDSSTSRCKGLRGVIHGWWYTTLGKTGPVPDNLHWVAEFRDQILAYYSGTDPTTGLPKSKYTLRTQTSNLQKVFRHILPPPSLGNMAALVEKLGVKAMKQQALNVRAKDRQQVNPAKEPQWLTWDQVLALQAQLGVEAEAAPTDWKLWKKYVTLSMMSLIPPLRNTYGDMEIITPAAFKRLAGDPERLDPDNAGHWVRPDDDDGEDEEFELKALRKNYLIESKAEAKFGKPPGPSMFAIYIDNDKVERSHPPLYEMLPTFLARIVHESLVLFPRDFLLTPETDFNKPLGKNATTARAAEGRLLKKCFPKGMGCSLLRQIFISTYYGVEGFDNGDENNLAMLMRHSAGEAKRTYHKRGVPKSKARTYWAFVPGRSVGWQRPEERGGSAGAGSSADHAAEGEAPFVPRRRRSGLPPVAAPAPPRRLAGAREVLAEVPANQVGVRPPGYVPPEFKFDRQAYRAAHRAEDAARQKARYQENKFKIAGQRAVNRINNKECSKNLDEMIERHNIRIGRNGKAFIQPLVEEED